MDYDRIKRDNVVEDVLKRLADSIISGKLEPGEKIPTEMELSARFGVSRNTVREAVKMLKAMGVLTIRRAHGTYVASDISPVVLNPLIFALALKPKTAAHLYELRVMFESMVLFLAIKKISDEEIANLKHLVDEAKDWYESGQATIEDYLHKDIDFHVRLIQSLHNPLIEIIGHSINALFPVYSRKSLPQENGIPKSIDHHYRMIEILSTRNATHVIEEVEASLTVWRRQLNGVE